MSRTNPSSAHVILRPRGAGCTFCGDELNILPCKISVFTAAAKAFTRAHRNCKPQSNGLTEPKTLDEWRKSWVIGVSSDSIHWAFTGWSVIDSSERDAPYDSDDLGRCMLLLDLMPEWRNLLDEVAVKVPAFAPLVPEWARLEGLHRAGKHAEVYSEIKRLRATPAKDIP